MTFTPLEREFISLGQLKTDKNPKGSGRKKRLIDWGLVQYLAHIHCTPQEIAGAVGLNYKTLWARTEKELGRPWGELYDEWKEGGKASLRHKQWQLAGSSASMAIFLGKNYLGQSDGQDLSAAREIIQEIVNYGDTKAEQWKNKEADAGSKKENSDT